jgi:hypothetical protein
VKKFLKTYTAITTGSMAGRDDGYPYTALQLLNDMDSVAKSHGTEKDERYYEVHAVNEVEFEKELQLTKERIKEVEKEKERAKKQAQLEKLKKELGEE